MKFIRLTLPVLLTALGTFSSPANAAFFQFVPDVPGSNYLFGLLIPGSSGDFSGGDAFNYNGGSSEPGVPFRGFNLVSPYELFQVEPCRPDVADGLAWSCSGSPSWIGWAYYSIAGTVVGNSLTGSFHFQGPRPDDTVVFGSSGPDGVWGIGIASDRFGNPPIITGRLLLYPVPEPGTLALFGVSLAGLGLTRRRKAG